MTSAQYLDQPAQFGALGSATQVVTLGIGGDDNGLFATALISCGIIDLGNIFDLGAPCAWLYGNTFANDIASDASTVGGVIRGIHARSPQAKVFVASESVRRRLSRHPSAERSLLPDVAVDER